MRRKRVEAKPPDRAVAAPVSPVPSNPETLDWVVIGEIVSPFGNQGEVKIYPHTDFPERLTRLKTVTLRFPDGSERRDKALRSRLHKNVAVMQLEGAADMNAAEALRGTMLIVPPEERHPLPRDTFYVDELVGLQAFADDGRFLGEIQRVLKTPANDVYDLGDLLIPATKEVVVRIDISSRRIIIHPIPGLLDEPERLRFEITRE